MATILDGKAVAEEIRSDVRAQVANLSTVGIKPCLAMVLVGDDAASESYVRAKTKTAAALNMETIVKRFGSGVSESELLQEIDLLNSANEVDGILVQLPLPVHLNSEKIIAAVNPAKDVDGFHPYNVGRYALGSPLIWPCTPSGILELLQRRSIAVEGQTAVVIGRSQIVGWPMAQLLLRQNATVIQCHSKTRNLADFTRLADILVCAVGQPGVITARHVKAGSTVVDVGMNRVEGRLVGDVDFSDVVDKVAAITPVPGGVGPLTVTMLMSNTVRLTTVHRGEKGGAK